MTTSHTTSATESFTRTNAIYLGTKIAADLRQMQRFYNRPSDEMIDDYLTEAAILIYFGYLESVEYGFKRDGNRVICLKYVVNSDGTIQNDDRSGRVSPGVNISDANWYSYLIKKRTFSFISDEKRKLIEAELPIIRTPGNEPGSGNGMWISDKSYSTNGTRVQRSTFKPR